ncbi:MAG: hypothetical protein WBF90_37670 [Rivularia sp. (in: cyanobacteria)]
MKVPQWILEHSQSDGDGWLEFCKFCGYPVFYSLSYYDNGEGDWVEYWQPVNPIEGDDFLNEIDNCPNCDSQLIDNDIGEDYSKDKHCIPVACNGCSNYHGQVYNGNLLICAIHPHGSDNESCPDFTRW